MSSLVYSLGIGVPVIILLFWIIYKMSPLKGSQVALIMILLTVIVYFPYGIINWQGVDVFAIHIAFYFMTAYGLGIITGTRETRLAREGKTEQDDKFQWPPVIIIAFFLVIAALDAVWITLAEKGLDKTIAEFILPKDKNTVTSFFPGTVSHDFQEKEQIFNDYIAQRELQEKRGWQIKKGWVDTPFSQQDITFKIQVLDKENQAIQDALVKVVFWYPANKAFDQQLEFSEATPGIYQKTINLAAPGCWHMVLIVEKGQDWHEVRARTWVNKPGDKPLDEIDADLECLPEHKRDAYLDFDA